MAFWKWVLLLLLIAYVGYGLFRQIAHSLGFGRPSSRPRECREAEELVQDPICQTFIPRKEALKAERDGKDYFFCSEGCLKRFLRGRSE
jgi:YHS domain-containing protein